MPGFVKRLAQRLDLLPADGDESDADGLDRIRQWCIEALAKPNRIAGLKAIACVADAYSAMDDDARTKFFQLLRDEFGVIHGEIAEAYTAYRREIEHDTSALIRLSKSLESSRVQLFRLFNTIPEGIKFLVDLRAELNERLRDDSSLKPMEFELRNLLESWFNLGFLHLERITWNSPAGLLEKLIAYEAVNEITNWGDLKHRLISDRACYAFIHPAMPGEPVIFVEVALVKGLPDNVQRLLDPAAPDIRPEEADTAVFYGISNAQRGLQGIPFGNLLIKQVTQRLRSETPNLKTFVTLSPVPRFRQDFLNPALKNGKIDTYFEDREAEAIQDLASANSLGEAISELLEQPDWHQKPELRNSLEPGFLRAARAYLVHTHKQNLRKSERRPAAGSAACPVAHFHASNGAILARINWLGDTSARGMKQSAGIMVNYRYDLADFELHQDDYSTNGRIATEKAVRDL